MICDRCGYYMEEEALTCISCGSMLRRKPQKDEGLTGLRQGKPKSEPILLQGRYVDQHEEADEIMVFGEEEDSREMEDGPRRRPELSTSRYQHRSRSQKYYEDAGRPQSERGLPVRPRGISPILHVHDRHINKIRKKRINWMKVNIIISLLTIVLILAAFIYLKRIPSGQRLLIKLGGNGPAQAYWQLGEDYLNEGRINRAIEIFEKADEEQRKNTDKTKRDNLKGMLQLATAYEYAGNMEQSEQIYRYLIENVEGAETTEEPYSNLIRILINTDRIAEAAELMLDAYDMTGNENFYRQRAQTLPSIPEIADISLISGRYDRYIDIPLVSSQGYEIYYVLEKGRLAEEKDPLTEGILYTEPISLNASDVFTIRAVCVDGDLVSDPLEIPYTISLPRPASPDVNLAPNTYERKQKARLRHEDMDNVIIYYTIDGSMPDENSPVYTKDEDIILPSGRVTLRAMAIDSMGIKSNTLERTYKINAGRVLSKYNEKDTFKGLELGKTLRDDFEAVYGSAVDSLDMEETAPELNAIKHEYSWGYAISEIRQGRRVIVKMYISSTSITAPRNTIVGVNIQEVSEKFRDLGQVANSKGDRGIYNDTDGWATITQKEDNMQVLEYALYSVEGNYLLLRYHAKNDVIYAISHELSN